MKQTLLVLLFIFSFTMVGQQVRLKGNVKDTASKQGLPNAVLMALRFSDSSLVGYSRTDQQGIFKPIKVPLDTYIVVISHPSYSDKTYLFEVTPTDTLIQFRNVVMPPKSVTLGEVEILAYRDKMFYKGDTLVFTADSFKTRANATVEDLLRKLPGFKVDASGKITVQGKEVDQVLVDGDEFFGTDPTIATRNLNATSIANVQVYDKKTDSQEEGKDETVKVLNLQMKEDAKKGYFGKVSGASDFQKFYEGELLANRFKGSQKLSIFGLAANTPKQAFGNNDAWKYGLSGEQPWSYDEESDSWTSSGNNNGTGIPHTIKGGFYFSDKIGKNLKINTDYTFNQGQLQQGSETNTQNFLQDTAFSTRSQQSSDMQTQNHSFNFKISQKLDSLTELIIAPKIKYAKTNSSSLQSDEFISEEGIKTRETSIRNNTYGENTDASIQLKLIRNFMKKDRVLSFSYQPSIARNVSTGRLNTDFRYYQSTLQDSSLVQERKQNNQKDDHTVSLNYVEPISKKFKVNLNYLLTQNVLSNDRSTYDFEGASYDLFNPKLSNSFQNKRLSNRAGLKFIYDVKKYRITVGSFFRNIQQENLNRSTNITQDLQQNVALPTAGFQYRFNKSSNFNVNYVTNSQLPDLKQMQPVVDNSNPNRLSIGTPSLLPSFENRISMNYGFYKGVSDIYLWTGFNGGITKNALSNISSYDSIGRSTTQSLNVDGNYNFNFYVNGGFPIFKKFLKINYNFNNFTYRQINYVNGQKNETQSTGFTPNVSIEKTAEKFGASVGGNYSYNIPRSSISSLASQPYYTYSFESDFWIKLPKAFFLSTDGKYTNNGNRSAGYNINYFIWNASLGKAFLKTENLVLSINAYDILNQNISNQRNISSNQIVDNKTQIIKRYFLLKLLYKFNNQKTKVDDNDY